MTDTTGFTRPGYISSQTKLHIDFYSYEWSKYYCASNKQRSLTSRTICEQSGNLGLLYICVVIVTLKLCKSHYISSYEEMFLFSHRVESTPLVLSLTWGECMYNEW